MFDIAILLSFLPMSDYVCLFYHTYLLSASLVQDQYIESYL